MHRKRQTPLLILSFLVLFGRINYSLADQRISVDLIGEAFEKAMRTLDDEKVKEQEAVTAELKAKLNSVIEEWLDSASKKRAQDLNKRMRQNWEKNLRYGSPVHYEYYLRDYTYVDLKIDIVRTESLIVPYRGYFSVKEKLYTERDHSPDVTNRKKFFYTVTRLAKVSFEYRDDKFNVLEREDEQITIEPGWPQEIIAKLKLI